MKNAPDSEWRLQAETSSSVCIGCVESSIHETFMEKFLHGNDFVFSFRQSINTLLSEHCDFELMDECKDPLVLVGKHGCGKTACLANWIQTFRTKFHSGKRQSGSVQPFIFWHSVGCTRTSQEVPSLLRRLITEIRDTFEISRPVPHFDEKLSWDLPRFLELGAKKGIIIIIIDGLERINPDNGETGLKWLPQVFPPNIRVILTTTFDSKIESLDISSLTEPVGASDIFDIKRNSLKMVSEIQRRGWALTRISDLVTISQRQSIVQDYLKHSYDAANVETVSRLVDASPNPEQTPFLTETEQFSDDVFDVPRINSSWVMYSCMMKSIVHHHCCTNPLFLRNIVKFLEYASMIGMDLWYTTEYLTSCKEPVHLYQKFFELVMTGIDPSFEALSDSCQKCIDNGGISGIIECNPWNKEFNQISKEAESPRSDMNNDRHEDATADNVDQTSDSVDDGNMSLLSAVGSGDVGDTTWIESNIVSQRCVSASLSRAQSVVRDILMNAVKNIADESNVSQEQFMESLCTNITQSEPWKGRQEGIFNDQDSTSQTDASTYNADSDFETQSQLNEALAPSAAVAKSEEKSKNDSPLSLAPIEQMHVVDFSPLKALPSYLTGGHKATGLGDLLSEALCLLYVARHGLREEELWSLLIRVQSKKKRFLGNSESIHGHMALRQAREKHTALRTAVGLAPFKPRLIQVCRRYDMDKCGYIAYDLYVKAIRRIRPSCSKSMVGTLLRACEYLSYDSQSNTLTITENRGPHQSKDELKIRYEDAMNCICQFAKLHGSMISDTMQEEATEGKNAKKTSNYSSKQSSVDLDDPFRLHAQNDVEASLAGDSICSTIADSIVSLGPDLEAKLEAVLKVLGVIHLSHQHVFVLCQESQSLREAIHRQFIRDDSVTEDWHLELIEFFRDQQQHITLRRCEELPWHLRKTCKWDQLKDVLSDLKTFELMFSSHLKPELVSYWKLLTSGPLPFCTTYASKFLESVSRRRLSSISSEKKASDFESIGLENRLEDTPLSRQNVPQQSSPTKSKSVDDNDHGLFDVVDVYNKSLELWTSIHNPPTFRLTDLLYMIAQFLVEFSCNIAMTSHDGTCPPPFLRIPLDVKELREKLSVIQYSKESFLTLLPSDVVALMMIPSSGNLEIVDATNEDNFDSQSEKKGKAISFSKREALAIDDDGQEESVSVTNILDSPTQAFYYYYRWMWIQFPWMALSNATQRSRRCNDVTESCVEKELEDQSSCDAFTLSATGEISDMALGNFSDEFQKSGILSKIGSDVEFRSNADTAWEVKRMDPRLGPLIQLTNNQRLALKRVALQKSGVVRTTDSLVKSAMNSSPLDITLRKKCRNRRSLEDDLRLSTQIPFSGASNKSKRCGSIFPSVEKSIRENQQQNEGNTENEAYATRFGGKLEIMKNLQDMLQEVDEDEHMFHINNSGQAPFAVSHNESLKLRRLSDASKLRSRYDQLRSERVEKELKLKELETQYIERNECDTAVVAVLQAGKNLVLSLKERFSRVQAALDEAVSVGEFYNDVLNFALKYPAQQSRHLESLEQELKLSRQQSSDLLREVSKMKEEREIVTTNDRIRLKKSMDHYKSMKLAVRIKIVDMKHKICQVYGVDEKLVNVWKTAELASRVASRLKSSVDPAKQSSQLSSSVLSDKQQSRSLNEVLGVHEFSRRLIGNLEDKPSPFAASLLRNDKKLSDILSSMDEKTLIGKLSSNEEMYKSLKFQQQLAESRLQELARVSKDFQRNSGHTSRDGGGNKEFESAADMESTTTASVSSNARNLDDALSQAELQANQAGRKVRIATGLTEASKIGVLHLASIIVSHNLSSFGVMKSDDILSYVDSQGKFSMEARSDDDIVKILAWCEDRIAAVHEAMSLENTKEICDPKSSMAQRQLELAAAVTEPSNGSETVLKSSASNLQRFLKEMAVSSATRSQASNSKTKGNYLPLAKVLASEVGRYTLCKDRDIRISTVKTSERKFNSKMDQIHKKQDKSEEGMEMVESHTSMTSKVQGLCQELETSMCNVQTQTQLRQAHALAGRRQGKQGGYGLVLTSVIQGDKELSRAMKNEPEKNQPATALEVAMEVDNSKFHVPSSTELKSEAMKLIQKGNSRKLG